MPFTVHEAQILATITCGCRLNNPPMLMRGVDVIVVCGRCGEQYGIVRATYDRASDEVPRVAVTALGPIQSPRERIVLPS